MKRSRYVVLLASAAVIEAGFVVLAGLGNFKQSVVEFTGVYLGISLFYLLACYAITRPDVTKSSSRRLMALCWVAGLLFRLTVLPLSPELSEDLNRYRWQGKVQAAGANPYTAVPRDPRFEHLRDATWPQVNRKDLPSVYGPLAEWIYAGWYQFVSLIEPDAARQVWWFKIPFVFLELGLALAVAGLLAAAGRPSHWLLIYWWSPLVVVEFWAQGHNDTLAVLFVVVAVTAALKDRWVWAFASLALATLSKFWPLILFPFFLLRRDEGRWSFRWKQALVVVPIILVVAGPYWHSWESVRELLEGFLGGWRNNDSLYGIIYERAGQDFDAGTVQVTRYLAAALGVLWLMQRPLTESVPWAIVVLLFLSANCFPWYLSWFLPFLALNPNAALLLWTALVSLAYHVLIGYEALGVWEYSDEFLRWEYVPVYGLLAGSAAVRLALRVWRKRRDGESEPSTA